MAFLDQLKQFFAQPEAETQAPEHPQLARTALLLEVASHDDEFAEQERRFIQRLLAGKYEVPESEFDALLNLARQKRDRLPDVYSLTKELNNHLDNAQRLELMTEVWQLIFADDRVDPNEEHLARKLQKLLRLDHPTWIAAKMEAQRRGSGR